MDRHHVTKVHLRDRERCDSLGDIILTDNSEIALTSQMYLPYTLDLIPSGRGSGAKQIQREVMERMQNKREKSQENQGLKIVSEERRV